MPLGTRSNPLPSLGLYRDKDVMVSKVDKKQSGHITVAVSASPKRREIKVVV